MIKKTNEGRIKCPACMSQNVQSMINEKLITFCFPVPKSILSEINRENISIFICKSCFHLFQIDVDRKLIEKIYSKFYKHYNLDTSVEFQNVYRERTQYFIKENLENKNNNKITNYKMLDIGCGEGTYFPFFSHYGYNCYGFEPSNKQLIAMEKNPNAIISPSYFEEHTKNIFNETFDVILLNWVLEHVLDLDNFFSVLKTYCKVGTKIFFQVPDFLYYVEHDLFLFYVHEHIHYFSRNSLEQCLHRFGFRLISYKNTDCPALLVCAVYTAKKIKPVFNKKINNTFNIIEKYNSKSKYLGNIANKVFDKYDELYFYGVGTSTYWLGEYFLSDQIKNRINIIDDNEFYFNKYVPSFESVIMKIEEIKCVSSCAFYIGTSPVYRNSIIKRINGNVRGDYDIIFIENNGFEVINN